MPSRALGPGDSALTRVHARQHWRVLRVHLGTGTASKRAMKVLALLVESGSIYSLLLVRLPGCAVCSTGR